MGDMGEFWKDVKPWLKDRGMKKRAANRKNGEAELLALGIQFLKKNNGAHLIVNPESTDRRVDYWPGTGLWRNYWGRPEGRGIRSLLSHLGGSESR